MFVTHERYFIFHTDEHLARLEKAPRARVLVRGLCRIFCVIASSILPDEEKLPSPSDRALHLTFVVRIHLLAARDKLLAISPRLDGLEIASE